MSRKVTSLTCNILFLDGRLPLQNYIFICSRKKRIFFPKCLSVSFDYIQLKFRGRPAALENKIFKTQNAIFHL